MKTTTSCRPAQALSGRSLRRIACAACLLLAGLASSAEEGGFPGKAIRLVVPYPAGGTTDVMARVLMEPVSASLGQPVVVDNRAGAGGTIGMNIVAHAAPDGYTIGFGNSGPNAIAPSIQQKMPYDVIRDFQPVALVAEMPLVLVVNANSAYASLDDYIEAARKRPGTVNFASSGLGSFSHLTGELFAQAAGIKLVHVPYKGGPEAMQDLLAGRTDSSFNTYVDAIAQIRAGKLRALAVTSAQRLPQLPEVPAIAEHAVPGFDAVGWFGMMVPAHTPMPVVERLHGELEAASKIESVRSRLIALGYLPVISTPAEFAERIRSDTARWAAVVKEAGLQLN
jgi:tripartite-type tricarboxylate transporter receptor subunit TctC